MADVKKMKMEELRALYEKAVFNYGVSPRDLETYNEAIAFRNELDGRIEKLRRVRKALQVLYDETADYIKINNLGDVHHNQSMKTAKAALDECPEDSSKAGEE